MKKFKWVSNQTKLEIPFSAKKIRFLILASFLGIVVKATNAGLKSFFSAKIMNLNMAQSFSTTQKTVVKKAASKR